MLWIFYPHPEFFDYEIYHKYAPDLARQPFYRWLDRYFLLLQIPLALLLYAIGGWSFVIYGIFLRAVLLWHSTWFVNSATHAWGYRNFEANDGARNLWWVSIVTYGEGWHNAGTKLKKQNVFDDFIAAAEYLIKNNYTSKDYLAISGASNGGLLIGATMSQRPDLCKVAFPAVGVMDMLRYNQFTAGAGWAYDYGTAQDSKEMFEYLYKYSPYHALQPASYPATMVTTADHDDRVVPAHSFKFASRLQETQKGPAPVLICIETKAGHGAGRSTAQVIGEQTDKWSFMFQNMNVTPYQNN